MQPSFGIGDKSVYPAHGVADVVALENKKIGTEEIAFYHLRVVGSGLKIIVPVNKAEENGMRSVASPQEVAEMFELLSDHEIPDDRQTWNRRYRGFMEKIRTGSLFEVAEVFRDLSLLQTRKTLSHGERQMLLTARGLLVRELVEAQSAPEDEVMAALEAPFRTGH
ncbi:MAG: CarD family transcriptional regulator [Myxococcales bacterium]|nr:CarD family transcriptional regulator [Myxococcales bacterium]